MSRTVAEQLRLNQRAETILSDRDQLLLIARTVRDQAYLDALLEDVGNVKLRQRLHDALVPLLEGRAQ